MSEEEKLHIELEENYEKIVEMLSNGNFLQLNGKAINLTELNEYINAQQEEIERLKEEYMILQNASDEVEEEKDKEIERLHSIIKEVREYIWSTKYEYGDLEEDNEDFDIDVYKLLEILDKVSKETNEVMSVEELEKYEPKNMAESEYQEWLWEDNE